MQRVHPAILALLTIGGVLVARRVLAKPRAGFDPRQELPDTIPGAPSLQHTLNRLRRVLRAAIVARTARPVPATVPYDALPLDIPWREIGGGATLSADVVDVYDSVAGYFWEQRQAQDAPPEVRAFDTILQWDTTTGRGPLPVTTFFADERRIERLDQALRDYTTAVQESLRATQGFQWQMENAT